MVCVQTSDPRTKPSRIERMTAAAASGFEFMIVSGRSRSSSNPERLEMSLLTSDMDDNSAGLEKIQPRDRNARTEKISMGVTNHLLSPDELRASLNLQPLGIVHRGAAS